MLPGVRFCVSPESGFWCTLFFFENGDNMAGCILGTRPSMYSAWAPAHTSSDPAIPLPVTLLSPRRHLSYLLTNALTSNCFFLHPHLWTTNLSKFQISLNLTVPRLANVNPKDYIHGSTTICREGIKCTSACSPALLTGFMSGELFQDLYRQAVRRTVSLILCDNA